jgi:hypothetical protein
VGRPTTLSAKAEAELVKFIVQARADGAVIDRDTMSLLGQEAAKFSGEQTAPELSHGWVRSFRIRHGMKALQATTSSKPDSSVEELQKDNSWRELYADIVRSPSDYGILDAAGNVLTRNLPLQAQIALDESPLPYFPRTRGSYTMGQGRRVPVAQSSDRRQITCTPMVSAAGELVAMQLIWRGTSRRCEGTGAYHPVVFHHHTIKKMQTRATFAELLKELRRKVTATLVRDNLPPALPMVVVVDNVSSHVLENMVPCSGIKTAAGLWKVEAGTYLFFTLANRSHTLHQASF